jgi:hypothetical protein
MGGERRLRARPGAADARGRALDPVGLGVRGDDRPDPRRRDLQRLARLERDVARARPDQHPRGRLDARRARLRQREHQRHARRTRDAAGQLERLEERQPVAVGHPRDPARDLLADPRRDPIDRRSDVAVGVDARPSRHDRRRGGAKLVEDLAGAARTLCHQRASR